MRIRRLVLSLFAAAATVVAGAPAPAQAAPPPVRAVTFNICGNVCRHGETSDTSANIAYRIYKLGASVAMLQEVCYSQFLALQTRLAPFGYRATFAPADTGGQCDNYDTKHGRAFGVALVARGSFASRVIYRLPSPYGEAEGRVVLGATAVLRRRTVFVVTTHTTTSGPNRDAQLSALRRWLTPIAATSPVIFGGDLNSMPEDSALDGFYTSFVEANRDRQKVLTTFIPVPRKIDYLFASPGFLTPVGVARANTGYSDHCMYLGVFR
ncbi:endonuclease/exonuclease/phosphatase family protein [Actinoplanes sp. NPDC026619]|uniref:endonuclease/exonuclease/phosphatase family protein n=1 Tax=Actinoplanes sp. NPDC026619 TaxID=3155798 RepID=UPI003407B105